MTTNKPEAHGVTQPLPPLGSFLRPIGSRRWWLYTLRVLRHFDPGPGDDAPSIEYERWGIRDGLPYDDGAVQRGHYIMLAPTSMPGVWRYPWQWPEPRENDWDWSYRWAQPSVNNQEVYFRAILCDDRGQMRLI